MSASAQSDWNISPEAARLHREALVWDNHGCLPIRLDDEFLPELGRYRRAGVDVVSINVGFGDMPWERHIEMLAYFRRWLRAHADDYVLVQTAGDIQAAKESGKLAVIFDIEGAGAIQDQLGLIALYYDLGVRWMLIAYNKNNRVGGGCQDEDSGLTAFGRDVIAEMARVGMVVCCSHTGERTALDVMATAEAPVILSHSNPRALRDHPRNVTDRVLRACAETGGVVGINGIGIFLGENDAGTDAIVRHIDYAVQLIGPDHVGLGLDYAFDQAELDAFVRDHPDQFPPELGYSAGIRMVPPEQTPEITDALLRLGYDEGAIRAILGGNFLRIAEAVWR